MNLETQATAYSTTKHLSQERPVIGNQAADSYQSVLFLDDNPTRKGEGGLRTKGLFKKSYDDKTLISIVTVVFNGEKYLEQTILSVLNQTYDNVEYIIIDGGSTDGTLDIIRKYEDAIDYWVSEPDRGISDAFNKGIRVANGDYINFQGDGDGFDSHQSLERVFVDIDQNKDVLISARIRRVDEHGKELFTSKYVERFNKKSLLLRMSLPHQGLFTHISFFEKYGPFDVDNTFSMDYEILLRAYKDFPKVITKDIVVAKWRADGLGNNKELEIFREYNKIKRDNKVACNAALRVINFWVLCKFYIKKVMRFS